MVLAISMPMIEVSRKNVVFDRVLYICYLIWFKKNEIQALIDLNSKVNIMILAFAFKLGFRACRTDVGALKIDKSTLKTFKIVLASF